ncbi:hypothetical protein Pmar_PMAR012923 [Perkinsus marinus ATCC 50983]|uniref:Uncharacterized protein n=1 Tax=Perkinsus marinus (strain ATCC 50983 / TXsc) TaxID=423536 RepID=C5LWJ6_PERM5|nr:hypothetical protein Pmar_PMAR012923 [Perkinsus marinus ATCC 50983]EEQ98909.1 hypothetical protein Pmar_PMAR012923 [Perkinsus marinus ATCC 50983]|eukprot:XP_002766192.1 hypothetical protein Pmar_PMAR012923 [Perkinsus marinus ATCC 50983]
MVYGARHVGQIEVHMQAAIMQRPVGVEYDPGNISMNSIDCVVLGMLPSQQQARGSRK